MFWVLTLPNREKLIVPVNRHYCSFAKKIPFLILIFLNLLPYIENMADLECEGVHSQSNGSGYKHCSQVGFKAKFLWLHVYVYLTRKL